RRRRGLIPCRPAKKARFSRTVMRQYVLRAPSRTADTKRYISLRRCEKSSPNRRTAPASGSTSRRMHLMSVVLPAPLGPSSPTISPGCTENDTSSTATSALPPEPYVLRMPSTSSAASTTAGATSTALHQLTQPDTLIFLTYHLEFVNCSRAFRFAASGAC